jgi:hypothetical protein
MSRTLPITSLPKIELIRAGTSVHWVLAAALGLVDTDPQTFFPQCLSSSAAAESRDHFATRSARSDDARSTSPAEEDA